MEELMKDKTFADDLEALINRYSMENASGTPDFILAQYLHACLLAWNTGVQQRETWYGRDPRPLTIQDLRPRDERRRTDETKR